MRPRQFIYNLFYLFFFFCCFFLQFQNSKLYYSLKSTAISEWSTRSRKIAIIHQFDVKKKEKQKYNKRWNTHIQTPGKTYKMQSNYFHLISFPYFILTAWIIYELDKCGAYSSNISPKKLLQNIPKTPNEAKPIPKAS